MFDVIETLASLTAAGSYDPFADVAVSALRAECKGTVTDDQVGTAMAGFAECAPQPDAAPALQAAVDAGMRVFTLSNAATATTRAFLARAGLDSHVEQVLSIDDVQAWKPAPAVYAWAIERAGVPPDDVALVAVHSWDVHGAHAAGMTTGWCPRLETVPTQVFAPPDVEGATLTDIVRLLADLPG